MLDGIIRPLIDTPLNALANSIKKWPITGNMITVIGFLFGVIACLIAIFTSPLFALIFLILNRVCDGLDGAVSRIRNEASDFGGYLDITLDFFIYAGFPLSMAITINDKATYFAVVFVLFAIVTTAVSFLAYAIIAAKRNLETTQQGKKSFFFSNGLMEGTETIIFLCFLCIFPQYCMEACIIFGLLCLITTALRIRMAYDVFK